MAVRLDTPVQYLKGVGPRRARVLDSAGLKTAEDVLHYLPFRYEDRTQFGRVQDLQPGIEVVLKLSVLEAGKYRTSRKGIEIVEVIARDDSGIVSVKFFNQPYLAGRFRRGQNMVIFGRPREDVFTAGLVFINPQFEMLGGSTDEGLHTGRIVPIYRRIGALTSKQLRQILSNLVRQLDSQLPERLPEEIRRRWRLPELGEAYRSVHAPAAPDEPEARKKWVDDLNARRTPGHLRLVFEEFFWFQAGLQLLRSRRTKVQKPHCIVVSDAIRERLREMVPFSLTGAQRRVSKEIATDLQKPAPMQRLLQGDVGSGKTVVAALAMALVMENGYQVAFMAPTELLAEQHFRTLQNLLSGRGYRVALLTSSVLGRERKAILEDVSQGEIQCLVGTHALIQERVKFARLAFVVIDEQHRFGVAQRSRLAEKGERPDLLIMTATPIPRSLALTLYGDLEASILDELPPGRRPVKTIVKTEKSRAEVYELVRRLVALGRQAYIVYPLVEESEKSDLKAATEGAQRLADEVFPEFKTGLMHGRMKPEEKDAVMKAFASGSIQVLVATTVIEVGIDVPNACAMVIEHAERFGLSQLHQLRGRIGRGTAGGVCILMVDKVKTREALERLNIMRQTNDGFVIAEKDLELRGPGEFTGTRQSGLPEFQFGDLVRDRKWMEVARQEAVSHVSRLLGTSEGRKDLAELAADWKRRYGLFQVG